MKLSVSPIKKFKIVFPIWYSCAVNSHQSGNYQLNQCKQKEKRGNAFLTNNFYKMIWSPSINFTWLTQPQPHEFCVQNMPPSHPLCIPNSKHCLCIRMSHITTATLSSNKFYNLKSIVTFIYLITPSSTSITFKSPTDSTSSLFNIQPLQFPLNCIIPFLQSHCSLNFTIHQTCK